jgi:hypothetical protein
MLGVRKRREATLTFWFEFGDSAELSLLDFVRLENFLSEKLGVKVDLVEKGTLKPRIGKRILKEVVTI